MCLSSVLFKVVILFISCDVQSRSSILISWCSYDMIFGLIVTIKGNKILGDG